MNLKITLSNGDAVVDERSEDIEDAPAAMRAYLSCHESVSASLSGMDPDATPRVDFKRKTGRQVAAREHGE